MFDNEMAKPAKAGKARRGASVSLATIKGLPPAKTATEFGTVEAEPRRGATAASPTIDLVPPAPNTEIEGQTAVGNQRGGALDGGALTGVATNSETGGHIRGGDQLHLAPAGGALTGLADPIPMANERVTSIEALPSEAGAPALATLCADLRALQRQRQFCIVSQSRCDRSCESFIARMIGFDGSADEKARKAVFKRASDLRKAVEKGKGGESHEHRDSRAMVALSACTPIILNSAAARAGWDALRLNTEKQMRRIARSLPAYAWSQSVAGFGDLGLGIILGETGDLAGYATKERVWKRLGLAVMDGIRQSRRTNADEALAHGFSPKRRAEVWAIADSMFKHQWRGAKEEAAPYPVGPYGAVYGRRKAHTADREDWTPKHRDNDARRIMTKALVEDLWRVWNGNAPLATLEAPPTA